MAEIEPVNSPDGLGRGNLTNTRRIELLEQDRGQQSQVLTGLIKSIEKGFTPVQMEQMRGLLREELGDIGVRLDDPDHVEHARADFRFLRRLRVGLDGFASKIGWAVIIAILGAAVAIFTLGLNAWKGQP